MSQRAVYDTMIFFQWAALPESRQHRTISALYDGNIRLCLSRALLDEVKDVLSRDELRKKIPLLTPERVAQVLDAVLALSDWFDPIPHLFTWTEHPSDDHLFNLAIESKADFLVTWENRIIKLGSGNGPDAAQLRSLSPTLQIITPPQLSAILKQS